MKLNYLKQAISKYLGKDRTANEPITYQKLYNLIETAENLNKENNTKSKLEQLEELFS